MVEVIEGNAVDALLQGDIDALVHCCNTLGVMGAGIAREIAERIPGVVEKDLRFKEKMDGNHLGLFTHMNGVYNLYGQENIGTHKRQVDYDAFVSALYLLRIHFRKKIKAQSLANIRIGMPYKIGCGLAGGDWGIIRPLIERILGDDFTVVFYRL